MKKKARKNPDDLKTTSGITFIYNKLIENKTFQSIDFLLKNKELFQFFIISLQTNDVILKIQDYNNLYYIYYLEFYSYTLRNSILHKILIGISFKGPFYELLTPIEHIKKRPIPIDIVYYTKNHIPTSINILKTDILNIFIDKIHPSLMKNLAKIMEPFAI